MTLNGSWDLFPAAARKLVISYGKQQREPKMLKKIIGHLVNRIVEKKIAKGQEITFFEALIVFSRPDVFSTIEEIRIAMPKRVVLSGVNDLVFERNARIFGMENLIVATADKISIQPPEFKRLNAYGYSPEAKRIGVGSVPLPVSRDLGSKIDGHFTELLAQQPKPKRVSFKQKIAHKRHNRRGGCGDACGCSTR